MELEDIYNYITTNKNELKEFQSIKLSKCYSNYFQIRLANQKESYTLKEIHYEIRTTDVENQFNLEIHFEEFDTTRYEEDQELNTLINNSDFEFFSWWTGKNKKNNQDNKSIRYKNPYTILNENDLKKFIHFLYETFAMFNDNLIRVYKKKKVSSMININSMKVKNILLYGAPGVGKTHNYKRLISMIEVGEDEKTIFDTIFTNNSTQNFDSSLFETIKQEKRIEFVTFHQSYSYEDFIEGFRPQESNNIELEDGIFKIIANRAKNQVKEIRQHHISFDEAFDILRMLYIDNELENLYTVSKILINIHGFAEKSIRVQSDNAKDAHYVKKSDLETVVQALLNNEIQKPRDIQNLDVKKDTMSLATFYYPIGKKVVEIINQNSKTIEEKEKNYYIIIDEINRGNISKIFGELITLIEEDKRDSYEVTLPYSKEKFKIPSNLYIIATMNSTDKSIATIDIALRRRFTFIKMKPKLNLVQDIKAKELMEALNEYIKQTRGEDYQLGHSYFMGDDIDLEFVIEYKVKPLLEEYFYGDDEGYSKALEIIAKVQN